MFARLARLLVVLMLATTLGAHWALLQTFAWTTMLADPDFAKEIGDAQDAWREVIATAVRMGVPVPGFSAALAYYDALRARRLPAALIQGLRDYFGAHTYHRTDREGAFHTLWAEDRSEVSR